jgi:SDR family mycofactocin-dependent oxidoreductase
MAETEQQSTRERPLDGRVALITGGARGQGRAHALALAQAGAKVVVCDIADQIKTVPYPMGTAEDLAITVDLVTQAGGVARSMVTDIRDPDDVTLAVSRVLDEFGRLDILAANAGICSASPFGDISQEAWHDTIDTNLSGTFNCLQAVLGPMTSQGFGRVVATSSMAGRGGVENLAHYCASKWGVIGLVKTFAIETAGSGITANVICPSTVSTPMVLNDATYRLFCPELEAPTLEDATARFRRGSRLGVPWCGPEEVSKALLYLVTDEGYLTGTVLEVSLGTSAWRS